MNRLLIAITLFLITPVFSAGQGLNFSRLNTSNGLSDNRVRCVVTDRNGFLWVGTNDGLNVYDGYNNTVFTRDKYPEMAADMVIHLLNDSHNRIWIGTYVGANWIDENRHFHPIVIRDSITRFYCPTIVETERYGVVLQTDLGHYYFDSVAQKWKEMEWMPAFLSKGTLMDAEPFSADKIIFTMDTVVALFDYKTRQVQYKESFALPLTACRVSDTSIAIGLQTGRVLIVNTFNRKIIADHQLTNILTGKTINTYLTEVRRAANGDLIVATDFAGLIIIDKQGNISRHTHDPLRPGSISGNNTYRSFAGPKGEVLVGTYTSGVNMANIYNKPAGYTRIFSDAKGNLYDNYITRIVEDTGSVFWLGTNDRLIRWNKKTGQSAFYSYDIPAPGGMRPLEIWALAQDKKGKLWVSAQRDGLSWFDKYTGSFHKIKMDTTLGREVATPVINEMHTMSDGSIWVGTNYGLYSFDPVSMKVTTYSKHPLLKEIQKKKVINFYEDVQKRIWFSAWGKGAWCYDVARQKLDHFSTAEGLAADVIYGFAQDNEGRMYIGTTHGFTILEEKNGKWILQTLNRSNGLRYERCEALLKDTAGDIWITNNKSLIRYSPVSRSITTYEENSGLSIAGFRANAALLTTNGEMMWGSESGINYFFPGQIIVAASQLQVSLYAIDAREVTHFFSHNQYFSFPFSKNDITFHFTAINLNGSHNILYQYKLEGYDKEWHTGTDVREARYASLPAGDYTFHVKASIDGLRWTEANNKVTLNIVPPIWRRWWFIALAVLAVSLMIHAAYWMRLRQIKEKEKIKAEYNQKIADIEMKALRAQMNPHFIFNCLNSINRYIVKSDNATASLYLTRFSKLIRLILDNSNSKNVLLSNELEALRIYIEMEALRFNNKFTYDIHLENGVCPEMLEVPPLIIQPYVENAIWHGLLHKESAGHLTISLRLVEDTLLQCVIEDDGVGRDKAKEYKSKSATTKKSLGMKLTEDRISILNKHASLNASVQIIDLVADNGEPAGTRVILNIPV